MGKSKSGVTVSFGHNSENVTGSYTLIECNDTGQKILVDFGMIQENGSLLNEYKLNSQRPDFKPKDISYIFITHAHQDHIGRLQMLYKWGCNAPIIAPEGSKDLLQAMMEDSLHIVTRDAEDLTKKLKKEYEPLFTDQEVDKALSMIRTSKIGVKTRLNDNIEYQLNNNGHIFKSVSITFWIKTKSGSVKKIIVSGDLGNLSCPSKFTEDFVPFENCNLLVGESTYGDQRRSCSKQDRTKDLEKLKASIETICEDRKGRVLIPVFAFGRSPSILATLYDLFGDREDFNIPIIYGSPLGVRLLEIFLKELPKEKGEYLQKVLRWRNVKIVGSFAELEHEVADNKPKIFCLPSGMMNSSYSVYTATKLLPHSNDGIIFVGYAVEGSLARKIKDKKTKTVTIDGKSINARCSVVNLKSFSSHAQYNDLISMYANSTLFVDKIALVHGDQEVKIKFGEKLKEEYERQNKTTKVVIANKSTKINI